MYHALRDIFGDANHIQAAHAGRQEHHRQHPVLWFTHGFSEGEIIFDNAVRGGRRGMIRRIFHQHRAKDNHHQHDSAPDNKGFFQPDRRQQVAIDKFKTEAAKAISANREGGNQTFTLREPLHAVR